MARLAEYTAVHELNPQQTGLIDVRKAFLRFLHFTDYISDVLEEWSCGKSKTTRVFTDQWPDCTCLVMFFCYESVDPNEADLCLVGGDSIRILGVLHYPGVIDWSKPLLFTNDFKHEGVEELLAIQTTEKCLLMHSIVKRFYLHDLITMPKQSLPEGLYFQSLDESHAEYIAEYLPYWTVLVRVAHFRHCISLGCSVGIFTDRTTPHKLVSWAVRSVETGEIHHLYTLEEYRGRGLASAVVREMSKRIQDKGEVPFCDIFVESHASLSLFQKLGFVEDKELYCFLDHHPEQ